MPSPPSESSAEALSGTVAALAVQLAAMRGQVRLITDRLSRAGVTGDLDLAAKLKELSAAAAEADTPSGKGPAAPSWLDLDPGTRATRIAELQHWADSVLRPEYGGYELRDCWANHHQAIWELSTLAAEWHRIYDAKQPDLASALEFYDRWLPGTMRRVGEVTRRCAGECDSRRRTGY